MMKKTKFGCTRCNYTAKGKIVMKTSEVIDEAVSVAVVDENVGKVHPITDYDCEKCNHKKSYFWIRQMRSGDEPESKFYECLKCKNVIRVDD